MRIAAAVFLAVFLLSGCQITDDQLNLAIDLRKRILEAERCSFQSVITADYGEALYTFQMDCTVDSVGNLHFTVTDPDSISGITGEISQDSASLTFDDKVLAFPVLADGQLTPVISPWLFINALRTGYLTGCSSNEEGLCIYIDDSYAEHPLRLEIYTDINTAPVHADIIWQETRILTLDIREFTLQ